MSSRSNLAVLVCVAALGAGCSGVNLSIGTGADASSPAGFYQLFEVPATSVRPWTERTQPIPLAPPPDNGASTASTLPAGPGSAAKMPQS